MIRMRKFPSSTSLTWAVLVLNLSLAAFLQVRTHAAEAPSRPNVILLITDDQGYGDLACHGNPVLRTPRLDELYRQSVRLTDFHVDPTCAETRAALMTGRYSARVGVWHTVMGRSLLRADEATLAQLFSATGYRTGIFGKWHLGDNFPLRPQDRGFQESLIHGGGGVGQTPDYWGNDYFDDTYLRNGRPEKQQGYCTDVFFAAAKEFIERHRDEPFFCYLATNAPHSPYNVDSKYAQPYLEKGVPQPAANFYGMIANIDENLGRLRETLRELELDQKTLLIYMTDNGTAAGAGRGGQGAWQGYNAGMRGQKGSQFDGGHRVPCFLHLPGRIEGGRDVATLTAHFDLAPTLIELCRLTKPQAPLDGRSLASLLMSDRTNEGAWPERRLVVHSQRVDVPEKWRKCAVMTDRWRLVDGRELYDISKDPGQEKDISGEHPEIVEELRSAYETWWSDVSTRFDEAVRIVVGDNAENPSRLTCHDWHAPIAQVPWSQQAIIERDVNGNGYWEIHVAEPGQYEITLRARPREAQRETPLNAVLAKVRVGEKEKSQQLEGDASEATLSLALPAGPARLQTWLQDAQGNERGAYYVYLQRR